ncbi:MAG: helix-turn-helix domain-containing protein [Oscillospiraceae bacterium]
MKKCNSWESLPLVMDTFEAAEVMHCHPETVKRLLRRGELKGNKIGGKNWRVTRDAVKEYLEGGATA